MEECRCDWNKPPLDTIGGPICWRKPIHENVSQYGNIKHRGDSKKSPNIKISDWKYLMRTSGRPGHAKCQRAGYIKELNTSCTLTHNPQKRCVGWCNRLGRMYKNYSKDRHTSKCIDKVVFYYVWLGHCFRTLTKSEAAANAHDG